MVAQILYNVYFITLYQILNSKVELTFMFLNPEIVMVMN